MKSRFHKILYILILAVLVGGLVSPNGLRGAAANNAWSISFLKQYFHNSTISPELQLPPYTHAHADLLLAADALKHKNNDLSMQFVAAKVEDLDPLALGIYAQILFNKEDYSAAFEAWKKTGDTTAVTQASKALEEKGKTDLVLLANKTLYEIDPITYTSWYADKLINLKDSHTAMEILNRSIQQYPGTEQRTSWLRLLGNTYSTMQMWSEAEAIYRQALLNKSH